MFSLLIHVGVLWNVFLFNFGILRNNESIPLWTLCDGPNGPDIFPSIPSANGV